MLQRLLCMPSPCYEPRIEWNRSVFRQGRVQTPYPYLNFPECSRRSCVSSRRPIRHAKKDDVLLCFRVFVQCQEGLLIWTIFTRNSEWFWATLYVFICFDCYSSVLVRVSFSFNLFNLLRNTRTNWKTHLHFRRFSGSRWGFIIASFYDSNVQGRHNVEVLQVRFYLLFPALVAGRWRLLLLSLPPRPGRLISSIF